MHFYYITKKNKNDLDKRVMQKLLTQKRVND